MGLEFPQGQKLTSFELPKQVSGDTPSQGESTASPGSVLGSLLNVIAAIGKYGVTTAIFALPLVVTCFGLYFVWNGVNAATVNGAKVGVGLFTVVFGSGLLVLLLWMYSHSDIAQVLKPKQKKEAAAA
jgi:hypothetical protein